MHLCAHNSLNKKSKRTRLVTFGFVAPLFIFFSLFSLEAYSAVTSKEVDLEASLFPAPRFVRKQTRFWEKVFQRWPTTTVIIHESGAPDRVIDIIDYKVFAKRDKKHSVSRKDRDKITRKYLKRYEKAVDRFKSLGKKATKFGPIEKRVFTVYKSNPAALKRLYQGKLKIRAQTGLADDFRSAARDAVVWLPKMEQIFSSYGLPKSLTRMAFVESMFNFNAYSKVGAAGIWQFMPATARNFMFVNKMVDERKSLLKSTRAAAQLLSTNYRALKSWPHAITAYNHGRAGMKKAIKAFGKTNYDHTILKYKSRTYGFASRNFYAEFLAARKTFDKLSRRGPIKPRGGIPDTATIVLKEPWSVATIVSRTNLNLEQMKILNPSILSSSFTTNRRKPLPRYFELTVPRQDAKKIQTALIEAGRKRYARR